MLINISLNISKKEGNEKINYWGMHFTASARSKWSRCMFRFSIYLVCFCMIERKKKRLHVQRYAIVWICTWLQRITHAVLCHIEIAVQVHVYHLERFCDAHWSTALSYQSIMIFVICSKLMNWAIYHDSGENLNQCCNVNIVV